MADDQESSNEIGDETETPDSPDYDSITTTAAGELDGEGESEGEPTAAVAADPTPASASDVETTPSAFEEDYPEEEIPDYIVNLYVNELPPGGSLPTDLVNAGMTDLNGNLISSRTTLIDSINDYTTTISQGLFDQLNGNGTAGVGEKSWWRK